jgi:hypothetical protein
MTQPTISAHRFDATDHQPPSLLIWIRDAEAASVEVDGVEVRLSGDSASRIGQIHLPPDAGRALIRVTLDGMTSAATLTWPAPPPQRPLPPRRRPRLRVAS